MNPSNVGAQMYIERGKIKRNQSTHIVKYIALLFIVTVLAETAQGQGCVVVRGGGACGTGASTGTTFNLQGGEWNVVAGARAFQSFRHFRGSEEETYRVEQGTEVINNSAFIDVVATYGVTDRLFVSATVPFAFNNRSSMYEHGGNPRYDEVGQLIGTWQGSRHTTTSQGIGDVRISAGYWLFDPSHSDYNYSVAVGVKLPTGPYNVQGTFYNQGANKDQARLDVVDQSIQLGDGGLGLTLDIQAIQPITSGLALVANLFYLSNITNTNGVLLRGSNSAMSADSSEFSSPDQYGARLGVFWAFAESWNLYAGGRAEGIPASDIVGGSGGFRRPGYAISAEPGIAYATPAWTIFASVPIAAYRNRTQSTIDKIRTEQRGVHVQGDAAFADVLFNLSISYRFGGSSGHSVMPTL